MMNIPEPESQKPSNRRQASRTSDTSKNEIKMSAEANPRQTVWDMTMAQMCNGTDPQKDSHVSIQAW